MRDLEYLNWLYKTEEDLSACISRNKAKREETIIEEVVKYISTMQLLKTSNSKLIFEAKFLHGHNSMVKFDHEKNVQRELCDLMIVSTLRRNNKFQSQRVTFVQAKKASKLFRRYSVDPSQLYLLTRFPEFTGVSGVFKNQKYRFRNFSESLGSYLLFSPDLELSWCTAHNLKRVLDGKKSLTYKSLAPLFAYERTMFQYILPDDIFEWHPYWAGNIESCATLNRFLQAWSSHCLGELWWLEKSKSTNSILSSMVKRIAQSASVELGALNETMCALEFNEDDFTSDIQSTPPLEDFGIMSVVIDI